MTKKVGTCLETHLMKEVRKRLGKAFGGSGHETAKESIDMKRQKKAFDEGFRIVYDKKMK